MAVTEQQIIDAVERIVATAAQPVKVILFGSYAAGTADEGSDIDLLVVERDLPDRGAEYLRLREAVGRMGVGVDLLLCTEREFERRSRVPGTVHYWAVREGKGLYSDFRKSFPNEAARELGASAEPTNESAAGTEHLSMTPQLEESLRLARRDRAAFLTLRNATHVDAEVGCFHARQAIEKALKAVMCVRGIEYRRTHDLVDLTERLMDHGIRAPVEPEFLGRLTPCAVEFRCDDARPMLVSIYEAEQWVDSVLTWAASVAEGPSDG
ncbi:MAG: HEPN domain-containing protein [Thermodesulfobacteriota bacterium]